MKEIESGKREAASARKKAERQEKVEKVEKAVKTPAMKARASRVEMIFQSAMGGSVTPAEIAAKIPKEAEKVYVKIEENMIYWVGKHGETGSTEIW